MSTQIRPFRRDDRDQLTLLVNAHVQAVVPGITVSTNRILAQLEREPGEFVVDPWVTARHTLVAEQRGRVVAAAHLLRYGAGPEVGEQYRDRGEIRWLLCWPDAPYWPDATEAGRAVCSAAVAVLRRSAAQRISADGSLPAPGVYGIPEQWPHVADLLTGAGFRTGPRRETVLVLDLDRLPVVDPPLPGLAERRSVGSSGTRLSAWREGNVLGYIEVELRSTDLGLVAGGPGWADIGNLWVDPAWRRRGVGRWLVGRAAAWLRLGHVDRLLQYLSTADDPAAGHGAEDEQAFTSALGFQVLTTTRREWDLPPGEPGDGRVD